MPRQTYTSLRSNNRFRKIFGIIVLLFTFFVSAASPSSADEMTLRIQPATLQIRATPPTTIQAPFAIENPGLSPLDLQIVVKRFRDSGGDTGKIVYSSTDLTTDVSSDTFLKNVSILEENEATRTISLAPKQKKNLVLSINVAKNIAPTDQYFSLIFLTMPTEAPKDTSIARIRQGIALPILVSLNGSNEAEASLDTYSSPLFLQSGPVPFTVKVKNSGDSFITVKGIILVKNMFGQTVGKIDVPAKNILAGTTRALSGKDLPTAPNATWNEKLLLGFYTATLSVAISPKDILYTRSIHFVAFPFSFLVGFVLTVIIAVIIFRRVKKKVSEA